MSDTTTAPVRSRSVEVHLTARVRGQLTATGDVRELHPLTDAVIKGAMKGYREWVDANLAAGDHAGWDYSIQLTWTGPKPKRSREKAGSR